MNKQTIGALEEKLSGPGVKRPTTRLRKIRHNRIGFGEALATMLTLKS